MVDEERLEHLGRVAVWYYEEQIDQSAIAERIGKSRSMVSRMLQEARDQGLVEIKVTYPLRRDRRLETQLCQTFGLVEALVLANPPSNDYPTLMSRLGRLGARYLEEQLRDGVRIGVGWGVTLHHLVAALSPRTLTNALVVQSMGAIGHGDPMVDGGELARWLAMKTSAAYRFVPAPLFVESEAIAQSLLQQPAIAETMMIAQQINIALVGIGVIDSSRSGLFRTGYFNTDQINALRGQGVVGDLMGHLIDSNGEAADVSANRCIISKPLAVLRMIPCVIGIAGEAIKAPAIVAVLRGRYLKALVTDSDAALAVLDLHAQTA
jgi:DNA-binding transcriptional regulator LsrR (DeoR family)